MKATIRRRPNDSGDEPDENSAGHLGHWGLANTAADTFKERICLTAGDRRTGDEESDEYFRQENSEQSGRIYYENVECSDGNGEFNRI